MREGIEVNTLTGAFNSVFEEMDAVISVNEIL
jgi:hypothetical protein